VRRTIVEPDALGRTSSSGRSVTRSAYIRSRAAGAAPLTIVDSVIGMPFSRLTRVLVTSARAVSASANRRITSARSAAVLRPTVRSPARRVRR